MSAGGAVTAERAHSGFPEVGSLSNNPKNPSQTV